MPQIFVVLFHQRSITSLHSKTLIFLFLLNSVIFHTIRYPTLLVRIFEKKIHFLGDNISDSGQGSDTSLEDTQLLTYHFHIQDYLCGKICKQFCKYTNFRILVSQTEIGTILFKLLFRFRLLTNSGSAFFKLRFRFRLHI